MFKAAKLLGLYAETPLHPGTGTTTGVVDLPIQRERHTGFPIIQASGLKGAMREAVEQKMGEKNKDLNLIFGPEDSTFAGSLAITDARILAFPVRSLSHVFVWVTCPAVLSRLKRDGTLLDNQNLAGLPELTVGVGQALVSDTSEFTGNKLVLEELSFTVEEKAEVKTCIKEISDFLPNGEAHKSVCDKLGKDLVILSDDDFTFLVRNATQVSARIVLGKNKTSENLWYEETLPPDTLFYTLLMAMEPRGPGATIQNAPGVLSKLAETLGAYLQIGGNETVGMGWCALRYYGEKAAPQEGAENE